MQKCSFLPTHQWVFKLRHTSRNSRKDAAGLGQSTSSSTFPKKLLNFEKKKLLVSLSKNPRKLRFLRKSYIYVSIKQKHQHPPGHTPDISLVAVGKLTPHGRSRGHLKSMSRNHGEVRRHQDTTPFFVTWLEKKKALESFVLCLKVNI